MRQAGRILPEYRAIRERLSGFKELVETPELAAEVTIQPVDILGVDAAIIFSDILVIPDAMGLTYEMIEKKGPFFPNTIRRRKDLEKIHVIDADELSYVYDAIRLTVKGLDGRVPLIGFAGAPFTILCYMVEGHGSKTFSLARKMLVQEPDLANALLDKITRSTIVYLRAQAEAGAAMLQIFDSWAGILSPDLFREFSLPYIEKICRAMPEGIPLTVFAKGANFSLMEMATLPCDTLGLDWNIPAKLAKQWAGPDKTLQGNLDPAVLYADGTEIVKRTKAMLDSFGSHRYIANLGHGVYPDTDPQAVKIFIETVKAYHHAEVY